MSGYSTYFSGPTQGMGTASFGSMTFDMTSAGAFMIPYRPSYPPRDVAINLSAIGAPPNATFLSSDQFPFPGIGISGNLGNTITLTIMSIAGGVMTGTITANALVAGELARMDFVGFGQF